MVRTCIMLGAAVLASSIIGCGEDNPAPTSDEAAPTAGLNALEQMQKGGKTPQEIAKEVDTGGRRKTAK